MAKLRRVGDLFEEKEQSRTGERRIIQAAENLAIHILFPDVLRDFATYIQRRPIVRPEISDLPQDVIGLGEYESMLLGKLLSPKNPIVCIEGPIGAGKTTTINYLWQHIMVRMDCSNCESKNSNINCRKLIAHIDFKKFIAEVESPNLHKLVETICDELRARCTLLVDDEEECFAFWKQILDQYDSQTDTEVSSVARVLLGRAPWLHQEISEPGKQLKRRLGLRDHLRQRDLIWYLRYMVLLWRYLLKTRFFNHRECALVILDNLDSLEPNLQRGLLDVVMRSAHQDGPTLVVVMRPETRKRHGLADELVDAVMHQGPEPIDVIVDRLNRFYQNPAKYFDPKIGLTKEQFQLVTEFLHRMQGRITEDVFAGFIRNAAGKSVRQALLLAQGLLMVSVADMKNLDITPHFLVRACITQGGTQFSAHPRSAITNPFDVPEVEEGRLLLKLRILQYLADRRDQCSLSVIRSAFTLFGYPEASIKAAVNALLQNECQLVRSDGYDEYRETWGDEQETLYLTEIGKGYIEHLVFDTDFVQEVMLDSRVESTRWPHIVTHDTLAEKLSLLYLFLKEVHEADRQEVQSFIARQGGDRYGHLFGTSFLSLDVIQRIYPSVGRILQSAARRYPKARQGYNEILTLFTSLVRVAEQSSSELIGVRPETVDEFIL